MIKINEMIGQEHIVSHFINAVKMDKLSHAYIINGEAGTGKKTIAKAFAALAQCQSDQDDKPCGKCHSCMQCETSNQPDIKWITHEKPNTISVDDVREQLNNDIIIRPYSSKYKIYIIDEAEKMNIAAQNAILKTIEEPPEYAIVILLTCNAASFLQTIMSRCVLLNMRPIRDDKVMKYLMEYKNIPSYIATIAAKFASGNLGKATQLAKSEEFNDMKNNVLQTVKHVKDMQMWELISAVKMVEKYKLEVNNYIDMMLLWYRDVLLYKATRDIDSLVFTDDISEISRQTSDYSFSDLQDIIDALDKAKLRLKANVNFDLVIELMFMTINERKNS